MAFDSRRNKMVLLTYPGATWEYPASFAVEIASNPVGGTYCLGESLALSVEAMGDEPFTYRWRKNGNDYMAPDAASPTISIAAVDFSHAGEYEVVVSNACGEVTSACATVAICTGAGGCPSPLDLNADGDIDGADIQRMVEVLLGG